MDKEQLTKQIKEYLNKYNKEHERETDELYDDDDLIEITRCLEDNEIICFSVVDRQTENDSFWLQAEFGHYLLMGIENRWISVIFDYDVRSYDRTKEELIGTILGLQREAEEIIEIL